MARVAGEPPGMLCGHDLRKPLRLGAVCLMTARANDRSVELRRLNAGIIRMIRQRPVAGFAGDNDVLPRLLLVRDIAMATFAGLVTSVDDGLGRDLGYGGAAKVSVLAKALGDDDCAHDHKRRKCDQHDRRQPDQVFYVLEQARLPGNAIRITVLDTCTSRG